MQIFTKIKDYFYSELKIFSNDQLKKDFETFPPFPLQNESINQEFSIIKIRGIGELYYFLSIGRKFAQKSNSEFIQGSRDFNELSDLEKVAYIFEHKIANFMVGSKQIRQRPFLFYLIKSFVVVVLFFKVIIIFKKLNSTAHYLGFPKGNGSIAVRVCAINKNSSIESVISHEHLHLLQDRDTEKYSNHMKDASVLISPNFIGNKDISYLLQKNEIEARLHEIVLSYYRATKNLPLTVETFFQMLAGGNQIGFIVTAIAKSNEIEFKDKIIDFHERDIMQAKQFELILLSIKFDLKYRFIVEVLAVMYGNLIKYYGDNRTSVEFMMTINRPNLYDSLFSC